MDGMMDGMIRVMRGGQCYLSHDGDGGGDGGGGGGDVRWVRMSSWDASGSRCGNRCTSVLRGISRRWWILFHWRRHHTSTSTGSLLRSRCSDRLFRPLLELEASPGTRKIASALPHRPWRRRCPSAAKKLPADRTTMSRKRFRQWMRSELLLAWMMRCEFWNAIASGWWMRCAVTTSCGGSLRAILKPIRCRDFYCWIARHGPNGPIRPVSEAALNCFRSRSCPPPVPVRDRREENHKNRGGEPAPATPSTESAFRNSSGCPGPGRPRSHQRSALYRTRCRKWCWMKCCWWRISAGRWELGRSWTMKRSPSGCAGSVHPVPVTIRNAPLPVTRGNADSLHTTPFIIHSLFTDYAFIIHWLSVAIIIFN